MDINKVKNLVNMLQAELADVVASPSGGPDPSVLAFYNASGNITLPKTNHIVPEPRPDLGENVVGYFLRVANMIGANPQIAGALFMGGATPYDIGKTGDPKLNMAIQVDAFANPSFYGLGGPGEAPVAAGPNPTPTPPTPGEEEL